MGEGMTSIKERVVWLHQEQQERMYRNEAKLELDHRRFCMFLSSIYFLKSNRKLLKRFKWVANMTKIVVFKGKDEVECMKQQKVMVDTRDIPATAGIGQVVEEE